MVFSVTVQTTYRKNVEPKKSLVHFVVCGLLKVTCKKGSSMENKSEVLNQVSYSKILLSGIEANLMTIDLITHSK